MFQSQITILGETQEQINCGDILKGEPSTTTHIAVFITVLSGAVNTQTIQPVCREQFCFSGPRG